MPKNDIPKMTKLQSARKKRALKHSEQAVSQGAPVLAVSQLLQVARQEAEAEKRNKKKNNL